MTNKKDKTALKLAKAHVNVEPSLLKVIRFISDQENAVEEPIKLLEINLETSPSGVVPISFGPSPDIPYPSVIVELTEEEYSNLKKGKLKLPDGWDKKEVLIERTHTHTKKEQKKRK